MLTPWKKSYDESRQHIKKQRHHFADRGLHSQRYGYSSSHIQMWELDHKESWAPKNWCFWTVVLEMTLESPSDSREIQPVSPKGNKLNIHWKDWSWSSSNLATWCDEPTYWKISWCWERLKAKREESSRGWDGWIESLTQWTWIWADSGRQWRTGKPSMLQSMWSQRVGHDLRAEQQQNQNLILYKYKYSI